MGGHGNTWFSNFDRHKGIMLPKKLNRHLAYLCGVIAGDGCLTYLRRLNKNGFTSVRYEMSIRMGKPRSLEVLEKCQRILRTFFNCDIPIQHIEYKPGKSALRQGFAKAETDKISLLGLFVYSKAVFLYLTRKLGLPYGRKARRVSVPDWVKKFKGRLVSFILGFFDADGCRSHVKWNTKYSPLYKTEKTYIYPSISIASMSESLIKDFSQFLRQNGIVNAAYKKKTGLWELMSHGNKNVANWDGLLKRWSV